MHYYLFNIGKPYSEEWWARHISMGVITTGFDGAVGDQGDRILHDIQEGDCLIAYANKYGAVGAGIVGSETSYRLARSRALPSRYESNHRHLRGVKWTRYVKSLSDGVPFVKLGIPSARLTKMKLDPANARRIMKLLPPTAAASKNQNRSHDKSGAILQSSSRSNQRIGTYANLSDIEGLRSEVVLLRTKRSQKLRKAALLLARGKCCVCNLNFLQLLKGRGVRVLQVHHRDQLSVRKVPSVTKQSDLAVVCANCHLLLHLDPKKALSVEQLRKMLRADGFYD
ncbi:MAG TPA: hypothetical protein VGI40_07425 [Pirellulaceae bacterium]|jgi:hypothetical protein